MTLPPLENGPFASRSDPTAGSQAASSGQADVGPELDGDVSDRGRPDDAPRVRLVCPACKSADGLWAVASFEGWHSVDVTLNGTRRELSAVQRGYPWYEITGREGYDLDPYDIGCSHCDWRGQAQQLVHLGIDGEPLPAIHPGQEAIC